MNNSKSINKQSGFFDFGAGLILLALFGGSTMVLVPDNGSSNVAEQNVDTDYISNTEYGEYEEVVHTAYLED